MKYQSFRAAVVAAFVGFVSVTAQAAPIVSGNGENWTSTFAAVCAQAGSCAGTTVVIDRHPLWMDDALTDAQWVSYMDTGYLGSVLAPQNGSAGNPTGQTPIMEIVESFVGAAGSAVTVRFWADDTLDVFFNGTLFQAASFSQDICSAVAIGCEPGEYWDLNALATGGTDTIRMVAYQVGGGADTGSNPFGVLYSGSYLERDTREVPEPATLAMVGLGLALGARRLHRTMR